MKVFSPHPVIRVITLVVFISGMSIASPGVLLTGALLLAGGYTMAGFPDMRGLAGMAMRLRWLFLAILLVYGWWTPGEPALPVLETVSPTLGGLVYGLQRIAVLLFAVSAVHLLTRTTESSKLLGAIMVTTRPFLGRSLRERFAVRLVLTLDAVTSTRDIVSTALKSTPVTGTGLAVVTGKVRAIYQGVIDRADQSAGQPVEVQDPDMPPPAQWLIPVVMAAGFWLVFSL